MMTRRRTSGEQAGLLLYAVGKTVEFREGREKKKTAAPIREGERPVVISGSTSRVHPDHPYTNRR